MPNYRGEMTSMSPSRAASGVEKKHRSWCISGVLFLVEKVSKTFFGGGGFMVSNFLWGIFISYLGKISILNIFQVLQLT